MELSPRVADDEGIFVIFVGHVSADIEVGIVNPDYQDDATLKDSPSESSTIALDDAETFKKCQVKDSRLLPPGVLADENEDGSRIESKGEGYGHDGEDRSTVEDLWDSTIPEIEEGPNFKGKNEFTLLCENLEYILTFTSFHEVIVRLGL